MQKYQNNVQDSFGKAMAGVSVLVKTVAGTTPTIYYDNYGTIQANPIITDSDGKFSFYAIDGRYNLNVTAGTSTSVISDIILEDSSNGLASFADPSGSSLIGFTPAGTSTVATTVQSKLRESVSVRDFGAVGDGVTDDTAAIQAAIDAVYNTGGGIVRFQDRHLVNSNLVIKDYVSLQGPLSLPDEILPSTSADYDSKLGVLIINSTATITTNDGCSLSNCLILRKGLNLPFTTALDATNGVASFAGTAITVGGAGSYFHHIMVLGFNKVIQSNGYERVRCEYVNGDNINGIELSSCLDVPYIENCHFWPFTTTHQTWTTGDLNYRSGTAFKFSNTVDWQKITNCFSYGYQVGFLIDSCNSATLVSCSVDFPGNLNSTSVGFKITGSCVDATLIGCQSAGQGTGYELSTTSQYSHKVIGCSFWGNDVADISVISGEVVIDSCSFRDIYAYGISVSDTANKVSITNSTFNYKPTPLFASAAIRRSIKVWNNVFQNSIDNMRDSLITEDTYAEQRIQSYSNDVIGVSILGIKSRGTSSTPIACNTNDVPYKISAVGYDGSSFSTIATLRAQFHGTPSPGSSPGSWVISTTPSGSTTPIDRVAIYSSGSWSPLADNAYSFGISGLRWSAIWSANGVIQTSDARTKTNIETSSLGLEFINKLRPVSYKFKVGSNIVTGQIYRDSYGNECNSSEDGAVASEIISNSVAGARTHWGLIAQEVKSTCDEAGIDFAGWLLTDKDNPDSQQALRYDQFISPLIKAVQELTTRVKLLEVK